MAVSILDLLHYEISKGTQRSVGVLYAVVFLSAPVEPRSEEYKSRCRRANDAIVDRWSMAGLERVKKHAWKVAEDLAGKP